MDLISTIDTPRSSNLVFTSAGDRSNVLSWLKGRRDFDLFVTYYGDRPDSIRAAADYFVRREGSKFQNLHHCYLAYPEILNRYDAIMVMDDDILIGSRGINRLFERRRDLDLWLLQPAFRLTGKISWDITRVRPALELRYTNFVEVSCPLFRKDKLDEFMAVYDPQLVGYGIDWWFLKVLGSELAGRVAIVDDVTCVNPHDGKKGGIREIDRLQPPDIRRAIWDVIRVREGIGDRAADQRSFSGISKTWGRAAWARLAYFVDWACIAVRTWGKRLLRPTLR